MSSFECPVIRVSVQPHPNADALDIIPVGGYNAIVQKGRFKDGDLAVYIPEGALVPDWLLKQAGFWDAMNGKGMLSGSAGNRVKAIRLRQVFSQGILFDGVMTDDDSLALGAEPVKIEDELEPGFYVPVECFKEGEDAAAFLGVTKWEPTVPAHMAGKVAGGDLEATIGYDFENIKKFPTLFEDGEPVVMTEKLHGTLLQVGIVPRAIWEGKSWADKCPDIGTDGFKGIVTSKGQGAKGLMLDSNDETNLYVQFAKEQNLWDKLDRIRKSSVAAHPDEALFIFGEIFGEGVQDLGYGSPKSFRAFDIYSGKRGHGSYFPWNSFLEATIATGIPVVPVLFHGPFSMEAVKLHTDGNTTVGGVKQIREGCVIKAAGFENDMHPRYGRKIAKSVSEAYLLRKGNATEFQ